MDELRLNDICIFDPDNKLSIAGEAYTFCKIVRIEPKLFGHKYYCSFCDKDGNAYNNVEYEVHPSHLRKLHPDMLVVIRYPNETPIVRADEVDVLEKLYATVLNSSLTNELSELDKISMAKLITKLRLFSEVIHHY